MSMMRQYLTRFGLTACVAVVLSVAACAHGSMMVDHRFQEAMSATSLNGPDVSVVAWVRSATGEFPSLLISAEPERTYFSIVVNLPTSLPYGAQKHCFQFEMAASAMDLSGLSTRSTGGLCVRAEVSVADIPSVVASIKEHAFSPCAVRLCGEQYQEIATPERFETYSIVPPPDIELFFDDIQSSGQTVLPTGFAAHPRNIRSPLVL